jgi:hypothetical protein
MGREVYREIRGSVTPKAELGLATVFLTFVARFG